MAKPSGRALALIAIFGLIPLLNFPLALLGDRTLFVRDIATVWAPQVEAVVDQVGKGEFPFFDGRRGFGQPLFADPRAEVLYPPAWIHWILPMSRSYSLFCAFHLIVAALGAARLAKRHVPDASLAAQATAGIAYAASGPLLSLVSHWHHLAAAAWMPWIVEKSDPRPGRPMPWLALAILVTLQVFAGSADYTFATFFLCLLRWLTRSDRSARDGARMGIGLALGLCLSAVQLLPSLSFARDADRDVYPIGWATAPLHPALTLETMIPIRAESWPLATDKRVTLFGQSPVWMFSHYLGFTVWILAVIGFSSTKGSGPRFAASAVMAGVLLAWGVKDDAVQALIARIPLISGLRFPTKQLAMAGLGLSLLAAHAVQASNGWSPASKRRAMGIGVLALMGSAGLYVFSTEGTAFAPLVLVRPLIAFACAAVASMAPRFAGRLTWMIPALVGADLLAVHTGINPTTPALIFRDAPPLTASIPRGARLYVSDYSISRHGESRPSSNAYELAQAPAGYTQSETLSLAATWYLNPPIAGRFGYLGSFDRDVLDFYRAPLKRSIEAFVTARDAQSSIDKLRRGSVDFVVTMDDPPERFTGLPLVTEERRFFKAPVRVYQVIGTWPRVRYETFAGDAAPGSPRVLRMSDDEIEIDASVTERVMLVAAVANDRGWRATVDGAETKVVDNPMAFTAVSLEPGAHRVRLTYRPPLLTLGAIVSVLTLMALAGHAFVSRAHAATQTETI